MVNMGFTFSYFLGWLCWFFFQFSWVYVWIAVCLIELGSETITSIGDTCINNLDFSSFSFFVLSIKNRNHSFTRLIHQSQPSTKKKSHLLLLLLFPSMEKRSKGIFFSSIKTWLKIVWAFEIHNKYFEIWEKKREKYINENIKYRVEIDKWNVYIHRHLSISTSACWLISTSCCSLFFQHGRKPVASLSE